MRAGVSRFPEKGLKVAKLRKSCLPAGTLYKNTSIPTWSHAGPKIRRDRFCEAGGCL